MDKHDEISKLAYELYEKSGWIDGRDIDNWLEAEVTVKERYRQQEEMEERPVTKINHRRNNKAKTSQ